jgi:hypothetical protein
LIDNSIALKPVDVFTWENYPIVLDTAKDRRWVLYLGCCNIEDCIYSITTTTQYHYYEKGGKRSNNNFFRLTAGIGGLEQDSIVDLTLYFNSGKISHTIVNNTKGDFLIKGKLPQENVNTLVRKIKDDDDIINMVKKLLYQYFRDAGYKVP